MKSVYNFVVTPVGERYNNTKKVEGGDLILNTEIYNHQFVNRIAKVISTPIIGDTDILPGDEVIIHHNIFRRFYDVRGIEKNSTSYFKEDLYFCYDDQIFLYKQNGKWKAPFNFCFVKPIVQNKKQLLNVNKERPLIGVLKYGNSSLEDFKINEGSLIGFSPNSEYEFVIENERLYRMRTNDITIKYENKGDEVEYNPSWASGCGRTY
mgnify:CR=1 FL=1